MDWERVRAEFPVCQKYTYLNAAGGSPVSSSAANEAKRFYDEMWSEGDNFWDEWLLRTENVRTKLARYINARQNEIAFTTNTSTAQNYLAQMIGHKGEVLTMRDEFPSTTIPWLNAGCKVKFVEPLDGGYPVDRIEKSLSRKTKVLLTSHVQYNTGFRQDMGALASLCKRHNLLLVVNATQSLGPFSLDVKELNISALTFTGLKWFTAGYGIAGMYISENIAGENKFPLAGWRSTVDIDAMDNMDFKLRNDASVLEAGCPHFPTIFALGGALDLFNRVGQQNAEKRVLELNKYLEKKLIEENYPVIPAKNENSRSGISIIETGDAKTIVNSLAAKKIYVSARGKGIRVSVNIFNNFQDIDTFVLALNKFFKD
jgi:selenocysteine lyase/cysteine desulfurase